MADEEPEKGYTWETEYERTWEALEEDASGSLQASVDDIVHRAKKRRLLEKRGNVRLGMMRHLFLAIDMSLAMEDQDLKPNRLLSCLKLLEKFIEEFFDQNPISQLGVIITRNKRAEKITELGGNPKRHITSVMKLGDKPCLGEPSLQNAMELAMQTLKHMPAHASREILVIFGSLTTCDPGNIHETIKTLQDNNVRCSVIGLAAEVRVCKQVCKETNGQYDVILDENHFKDLLSSHVSPPAALTNMESSLIRMGFPHHQLHAGVGQMDRPSMCMCHLDSKTGQGFSTSGYFCPQCKSKYCELPVECKACGLTLVSAPHLARSYHHLFPCDPFKEEEKDASSQGHHCCFSCQKSITENTICRCNLCQKVFCIDCDLYIHETLHSCPGCACTRQQQATVS